jgi:hypothetical protein
MMAQFVDQAQEHWDYEATAARTTGDAHRDWHIVNGWSNGCPLDCIDSQPEEPAVIGEIQVIGDDRTFPLYDGDDVAAEARRIAATVGRTVTISFG